jgi:hypothetical protein
METVTINREDYDRLLVTAYAFDFLTNSLLMNAGKSYGLAKLLRFDEGHLNEVLSIMCPEKYDQAIARVYTEEV